MSDIPYSVRETSTVTRYPGFGTNNAILTSNGSGAAPAWKNNVNIDTLECQTANFTGTVTCDSSLSAQTFAPTYSVIPSLAGKIGQIVDAGQPAVTLVANNLIQVRSITIPYTGVWSIKMCLYLGNAGGLTGTIIYPTSIMINGSITHNFYGTNVTGVNGTITRNLSVNDVVTFSTYLTGSGATGMSASQRAVWGTAFTFLTATRIA